ncbi:MAG: bifunctional diaminohydroxyphosphoribosylaminopyrimidine deaminase/5-amino-6-(5-phosphoribosylamino)uracil reductase RibD [Acidobacteriota bacterium]
MIQHKDLAFMRMAYSLAEKARGWVSPNPLVGAVVVKKGIIIGWGHHEKPGFPHAEIVALEIAGKKARNSTLYQTLEPCVHWGKTPPCIDRVIEARPRRVVISAYDANPLVYKKGIRLLKNNGIDVEVGLMQETNSRLNEAYIKYITRKIPFVTIKTAVSLDGKAATQTGSSRWITSEETRKYIHLLRGEHDAVITGIQTILHDDPLLTLRHSQWEDKKIIRIVLDSRLRFPLKARILQTLDKGNIIICTSDKAPSRKADKLEKKGIKVIRFPSEDLKIPIKKVLKRLGEEKISSVLVEGGGILTTSFLQEHLADKIIVTLAPSLVGGKKAPGFFQGTGVQSIQDALRLKKSHCFQIGSDLVVEGYL